MRKFALWAEEDQKAVQKFLKDISEWDEWFLMQAQKVILTEHLSVKSRSGLTAKAPSGMHTLAQFNRNSALEKEKMTSGNVAGAVDASNGSVVFSTAIV